jgi:hypothetical protein
MARNARHQSTAAREVNNNENHAKDVAKLKEDIEKEKETCCQSMLLQREFEEKPKGRQGKTGSKAQKATQHTYQAESSSSGQVKGAAANGNSGEPHSYSHHLLFTKQTVNVPAPTLGFVPAATWSQLPATSAELPQAATHTTSTMKTALLNTPPNVDPIVNNAPSLAPTPPSSNIDGFTLLSTTPFTDLDYTDFSFGLPQFLDDYADTELPLLPAPLSP